MLRQSHFFVTWYCEFHSKLFCKWTLTFRQLYNIPNWRGTNEQLNVKMFPFYRSFSHGFLFVKTLWTLLRAKSMHVAQVKTQKKEFSGWMKSFLSTWLIFMCFFAFTYCTIHAVCIHSQQCAYTINGKVFPSMNIEQVEPLNCPFILYAEFSYGLPKNGNQHKHRVDTNIQRLLGSKKHETNNLCAVLALSVHVHDWNSVDFRLRTANNCIGEYFYGFAKVPIDEFSIILDMRPLCWYSANQWDMKYRGFALFILLQSGFCHSWFNQRRRIFKIIWCMFESKTSTVHVHLPLQSYTKFMNICTMAAKSGDLCVQVHIK